MRRPVHSLKYKNPVVPGGCCQPHLYFQIGATTLKNPNPFSTARIASRPHRRPQFRWDYPGGCLVCAVRPATADRSMDAIDLSHLLRPIAAETARKNEPGATRCSTQLRMPRNGSRQFFGCSNFPDCRFTRAWTTVWPQADRLVAAQSVG